MQSILNDLKNGDFKQVYLLYGTEDFLKKHYADRLHKALADENDRMNTHFYEGKDHSVGEIIDLAETLPFLAQRRVIFWKNSGLFQMQKSGKKETEGNESIALADYLSSPCETTFFVFIESTVSTRGKLFKTVQSVGHAAEFVEQNEQKLLPWIAGILGKEGKKITKNTAQLFLQRVGNDMQLLHTELEKLICYAYDREVITDEDIEAVCTTQVSDQIFKMIDAIAVGKQRQALQYYYDLLALKRAPQSILPLIAKHCNHLLQVKELRAQSYSSTAIAEKLNLRPFVTQKYLAQSSNFKLSTLRGAVEQCVEIDEAIKSSRMDDGIGVEILIMTVLKPSGRSDW